MHLSGHKRDAMVRRLCGRWYRFSTKMKARRHASRLVEHRLLRIKYGVA